MTNEKVKLIICFSLVLIGAVLIEFAYEELILGKKVSVKKDMEFSYFLFNPGNETKNLFFGDSHVVNDINPIFFENSYNMGNLGGSYLVTYYELKTLLDHNVKPDKIFLQLDLHSLNGFFIDYFKDVAQWVEYRSIMPPEEYRIITKKSKAGLIIEKYLPFIGRGQEFLTVFFDKKESKLVKGWQKLDGSKNSEEMENDAEKTYERHFKNRIALSPEDVVYFNRTLQLAQENNISIIFVKYPVSYKYYKRYTEEHGSGEDYYNKVFSIANSSLDSYYVLDYQALFFGKDEYFYDSHHLNQKGAMILSKLVNNGSAEIGIRK